MTISGGIVRNFEAGVRVADSTDIVIRHNLMTENTDGIDLQAGSHQNSIRHNTFRDNRARGIMARSGVVGNVIRENTFTGNRVGILLFGAAGTRVRDNIISTSVLAGIRFNVLTTGNVVKGNVVSSNPAGIEFLITPTGSSLGNKLVANTIATNTCGLKGPLAGNTLRSNTFSENGAETCQ